MMWLALVAGCAALAPSARADAPSTHRVEQKDKSFAVTTVQARTGDKLELENAEDAVAHHVFSTEDGYSFNEAQKPGVVTSVDLDHPGTFTVRCAIHPNMKLEVVVAP